MAKKRQKTTKKRKKPWLKIYGLFFLVFVAVSFFYVCLKPNVNIRTGYCYFYIPAKSTTNSVYNSLKSQKLLGDNFTFWLTQKLFTFKDPSEGLYELHNGWGNFWLIQKLKEGNNKPHYSYRIRGYRSRMNTIKSLCRQANLDLNDFKGVLNDSVYLEEEFNLDKESIYCIFIPGTYKTYKGRNSKELLADIYTEYRLFWNSKRRKLAKKIKSTPEEVIKLASIVYAETKDTAEMPIIAGVYLNRLKKNIRLQADPTLLFARKASGLKRIYFKFIDSTSPYNTYKNKGIPPGPIGPAPLVAIEAVLNPKEHDYLYFCAKEDFSGCHYFSETFEEHKKYARKYRSMLDRKKIK